MFKKNKEKKQVDRDQLLEDYYKDYNVYEGFHTQSKFMEKRINEQKYGVFGNVLITIIVIAVMVAIFYFLV